MVSKIHKPIKQPHEAKVICCISVYNNADYLRATIESVIRLVDQVIIVDGRYATYPGEFYYSTDGTLDIIAEMMDRYDTIVYFPARLYKTQVEKRNVYIDMIMPGDWMFVLDGDEIFSCREWDLLRKDLDAAYPKGRLLIRHIGYSDRYRFIVKKLGMRYRDYHWNIIDPETGRNAGDLVDAAQHKEGPPTNRCTIVHMKHQRASYVVEDKKIFYENRKPIEEPHVIRDMVARARQMKAEGLIDE